MNQEEYKLKLRQGSIYGYEYALAGTFGKVTDIEGNTDRVPVVVQSEEHDLREFGTVLPEVQVQEIRVEYIPDLEYKNAEEALYRTQFTTVTTYTEVQYYSKQETLECSVLSKNKRSSGKSPTTSGTATAAVTTTTSTASITSLPEDKKDITGTSTTTTNISEKIIDFVRYIAVQVKDYSTGSTETKIYSTRKASSIAVDSYVGTYLDTLVIKAVGTDKLKSTSTSTKQFLFPTTVVQYNKNPHQYFIQTLQYCIDTCTVEELREWVSGLYGNSTTRKWLYFLNKYPRARHWRTGSESLQSLVEALNTVYIFGFPLPIVKRSTLTGLPVPAFKNSKINSTVGTYFNFPIFKQTTSELQREYIEGLKAKEFSLLKFNSDIAEDQVGSYGYIHIKYAGKILCSKRKFKPSEERKQKRVKRELIEESAWV
jgi:hypothetical protein